MVVCLRGQHYFVAGGHLDVETVELNAPDLRFTEDEVEALAAAVGAELPAELAGQLWAATGGWPEPTRSLVLRLRESGRSGPEAVRELAATVTGAYLRDRLADEYQRDRLRFALRTSVAREFTDEVAELLTDDPEAKSHLQELEAQGFLITRNGDHGALHRWPRAARRTLRRELERADEPLARRLHARLARWYHEQGDLAGSLHHAVASQEWPLVIEVIESSWRGLLVDHNEELVDAFVALPLEHVERSPRALALRDAKLHVPDDRLLAAAALPDSRAELVALGRREDADQILDTTLAVLIALRRRGVFALAREYGLRALQVAIAARNAQPAQVRDLYATLHLQVGITQLLAGDVAGAVPTLREAHHKGVGHSLGYAQADAAAKLALTHALLGESDQADAWLALFERTPLRRAPLGRNSWLLPAIRNTAAGAELLLALGRLDLARAARSSATLARSVGEEELWPLLTYARAQHALHDGTVEEMLRTIDAARHAHRGKTGRGSIAGPLLAAAEADLHLALGRANTAERSLESAEQDHPALRLVRARLDLLAGRTASALQLTYDADWDRAAARHDRLALQLIRAVAAQRLGDVELATATLERVTRAAAAAQTWRPFLTVPGAELRELLDRSPASRELLPEAVLESGSLFPDAVSLVELTERERSVLVDLAKGLSLAQIAKASVLSDNTVRSQRRSLYRKLGTSDRAEAIARAREWGLLPRGD
jgi:LuxR family maltose regulon positive regulatory protein